MVNGGAVLRAVADLLERAGRETDAAIDYTHRAQQRLLEGGLEGIVANMDRIVVHLHTDRGRIDEQRHQMEALHEAAARVDGESVPEQIVDALTPVAAGIGAALTAFSAVDAELSLGQDLTAEVLVGGAPHHIQSRIGRVRGTLGEARRALGSAAAAVDDALRHARGAGGVPDQDSDTATDTDADAGGGGGEVDGAPHSSGGAGTPDTVEAMAQRACGRVTQLQHILPEATRSRVTMGVGVGRDRDGHTWTVVSSSERNGYLRKQVRDAIGPGEEIATGDGTMHAEVRALKYMDEHHIDPVTVGAGRPICSECEQALADAGVVPASPLKGGASRGRSS